MTTSHQGRHVGRGLDAQAAEGRSRQILALADPGRLRVLSALASAPEGSCDTKSVVDATDLSDRDVQQHLAVLTDAQLIIESESDADRFALTAEAWVRFGGILNTATSAQPTSVSEALVPSDVEVPTGVPSVLHRVIDRLAYRFASTFSRETVEKYVLDSYALLASRARVAHHLPSLTARFAGERLSALAASRGTLHPDTPEILFVCVHNAGRSQMAAAYLRHLCGDRVHVRTAGSAPAGDIDQVVRDVLEEVAIPLVDEFPKPLTDEVVQAADFVITMGCGDACPIYPGRRYIDWDIADPVGQPVAAARAVRDQVFALVQRLADEITSQTSPSDRR